MKNKKAMAIIMTAMLTMLTACGTASSVTTNLTEEAGARSKNADGAEVETIGQRSDKAAEKAGESAEDESTSPKIGTFSVSAGELDTEDLFSKRDMEQSPDLYDAENIEVSDDKSITIDSEGIYVISGQSKETTIYIEAGDEDKIQLVLDNVTITNSSVPVIYVKSADKVFITTADGDNNLSVTGAFQADGDTNTDAVIFSKDDLVLNGTGTLNISSSDNAVASKDTLKITGGNIVIDCKGNAFEAHDAIEIADGNVDIKSCNDGLHAKDNGDDIKGYIYIGGGTFSITAADDAIHATHFVRIDGGNLKLNGAEGIEATVIQVNDGTVDITASDDGINAARKSNATTPSFELNGGEITINMEAGDTDGVDSNGDITINGGTLSITGRSTFDCDGKATYNGGTIIENGKETNSITNQMMGGKGSRGGMGNKFGTDNDINMKNRPEDNSDNLIERGKMKERGRNRMQDKDWMTNSDQ